MCTFVGLLGGIPVYPKSRLKAASKGRVQGCNKGGWKGVQVGWGGCRSVATAVTKILEYFKYISVLSPHIIKFYASIDLFRSI